MRRENMAEPQPRPPALQVLTQEALDQFGPHYDENHQSPNGRTSPSRGGRGQRGVTFCADSECCQWWARPCDFCAAAAAAAAAAAGTGEGTSTHTPAASSPPDRAPDSPTRRAQPEASNAELKAARRAARKRAEEEMLRQREAVLAAQTLDAGMWAAIRASEELSERC
jgi:hypothetical protein